MTEQMWGAVGVGDFETYKLVNDRVVADYEMGELKHEKEDIRSEQQKKTDEIRAQMDAEREAAERKERGEEEVRHYQLGRSKSARRRARNAQLRCHYHRHTFIYQT